MPDSSPEISAKRLPIGGLLFMLAASLVLGMALLSRFNGFKIYDDAYMFVRYADHLLAGHGLVWNIGEGPVSRQSGGRAVQFELLLGTDFPAFGLPNGLENDANGHCLQTLCGGIVVSDAACGGQYLAGTLRERHGNNLCAQLPDALSVELGKPSNREGQCLACRNTRRMRLVDQAGSAHFHLGRANGGLGFGQN